MTAARAWAIDPDKSLADCSVDVWRVRDGLPGAWVRAITQSQDGYLWVGTYAGLARHDGSHLERIEFEHSFDIIGVAPARDGTIWISATQGPPICWRAGALVDCFPAGQSWPADASISAIHEDARGTIWIAASDGIHRFAGGQLTLDHAAAALPFRHVNVITHDRRGRVWLATKEGLFVDEGQGFSRFRPDDAAFGGAVDALFENARGQLWVATPHTLLRIADDGITRWGEADGLPTMRVYSMIEDRDGAVWLATGLGLTRFAGGKFVSFGKQDGLPDSDARVVFEDREGSLWVGTFNGGLAQFTDRTLNTQSGPPSVRTSAIEGLCEDAGGAMWIATRHGLIRWKDGVERLYTRDDGLPSSSVFTVLPGRNGELWIGTDSGLARLRGDVIDVPYPSFKRLRSLYLDAAGTLYVANVDTLARVRDGVVQDLPAEPGLRAEVHGMGVDDQGIMWVTTSTGLARVDHDRLTTRGVREAAGSHFYGTVGRDREGTLWFGTSAGLARRRGGQFHLFGPEVGLPRDQLYQVLDDGGGHLWIGTGSGILRVSKESLEEVGRGRRGSAEVISFDTSDRRREVAAMRTRQPNAWQDHRGRLWFATIQGIATIDPHRLRLDTMPPPVVIEDAIVDGRHAGAARRDFPAGPGALEFHFGAVTLIEARQAQHRYLLEGFDRRWTEAGARRVAYYTNIPPGSYRFRVQAANADGVWNEAGASFAFRLAPHFYRTGWFYALLAAALVGAAGLLYRARLARLRGEYLAVLGERTRVARELHDSLLQAMSAVSLQLRRIRKRLPPAAGPAARELETVENIVTTSLDETRRYVWNLRQQPTGDGDLGRALGRLAGRLTEGRAELAEVTVEGEPRHLPHDVQGALFRITQEAITNVLKHAHASQINVRLVYGPADVRLTIEDDGRGFDVAQAAGADGGHFGLAGMRERVERFGTFSVTSEPGRGSTIEVCAAVPAAGEKHD